MNMLLEQAAKWFADLGIETRISPNNTLMVNRTNMVDQAIELGVTENAYNFFLGELKTALNSKKLFWGTELDNWNILESF